MNRITYLFALLLLLFAACKDNNSTTQESDMPDEQEQNNYYDPNHIVPFEITAINGLPEKIDGCSCYFAANKEDLAAEKYIYVDSKNSFPAFVAIDGELIELAGASEDDYQVKIEYSSEKQIDQELSEKTGTITFVNKEGKEVSQEFVGECGC